MSTATKTEDHSASAHGDGHGHDTMFYVKIWAVLVVLLVISVLGPMIGIQIVTLITAFGIATVKAYLVAKNFMHLGIERRYIVYLLISGVAMMLLLFFGTAPDVLRHSGARWDNVAAQRVVQGLSPDGVEPEWEVGAAYASTCAPCHGDEGGGDGAAAVSLDPTPADFTDPEFWATRDFDRIKQVIDEGAQSVGGSPLMVAFGETFDEEQLQAIAEYVVAFAPELEEAVPEGEPEGEEGEAGVEGEGDSVEGEPAPTEAAPAPAAP